MNITKEEALTHYKSYRDVMPDGIEAECTNRIEHLIYEIPFESKVLDVGANSGEVIKLIQEKRKCVCFGIDVSEIAVSKAREKGLPVEIGDAENLPFKDEEFDVVLMMEVLNHIHDPLKALQEAVRVLKPEGILLGSVPHKTLEKYAWEDAAPHHPYHDLESLGILLDKAFKFSHLWPLKGAQQTVAMADSFLGPQTTEILFKCGNNGDDHKWWELMRKKKVLRVWFGPTQHEGDVYYRMRSFANRMNERGIEAAYENYDKSTDDPSNWQNRCKNKIVLDQIDSILKVADVSVWQIINNPDALALLRCWNDFVTCSQCGHFTCVPKGALRACGKCHDRRVYKKPIVTDIDDWLLDIPQYNIASGPYKPNSALEWYALKQLENSDAILCSTEFIMKKLKEIEQLKEKTYYVIPNCIDFNIWNKLKEPLLKKPESMIRIGYSGCGNHGGDLYMIRDVITALLHEFGNLEFIWAVPMKNPHDPDKNFEIGHPRAKCVNEWYTIAQFPQVLKNWDLDIGIAPLLDNNFNRSKSNLRWLEYSALKVPTVASNVEPFRKSIIHNSDGYLCRGSQEWYTHLKELILSQEERKRIGETAYARVHRDFNLDAGTDRYVSALEEIKRKAVSLCSAPS